MHDSGAAGTGKNNGTVAAQLSHSVREMFVETPQKSPFVKKKWPCPVCGQEAPNRFIIPKSYLEKGMESDRHPTGYKWLDEAFQDINPSFYHFWHCPACKYTSSQKDFLKPGEDADSNYSTLKKFFQRMNPVQKQIVQLLGTGIDYDKMNFPMAMNLHLLAIFIQELVSEDIRDTSKLGSYYLRTAWLHRDQKAKETASGEQAQGGGELAAGAEVLDKLAKVWPEIPRNEPDCLKKAAAYYELAYQRHPRYADIVMATDLMILISDLYMRAGDMQKTMQCLNVIMQTGQKFRVKQTELLRREKDEGKLTVTRKAQIDAQTNRVNALMEKAGDMRQHIIQQRMKQQEPKVLQAIQQLQSQGLDTEQIREKLQQMNVEPQLITKLLGEPKRKKFLGLF